MWEQLRDRLPPRRRGFDEAVWILVLLYFGAGDDERVDTAEIACLLSRLGWSHGGGDPVTARDVQWIVNDVWAYIGNIGANVSTTFERRPSPVALALIRGALLTEATDG